MGGLRHFVERVVVIQVEGGWGQGCFPLKYESLQHNPMLNCQEYRDGKQALHFKRGVKQTT